MAYVIGSRVVTFCAAWFLGLGEVWIVNDVVRYSTDGVKQLKVEFYLKGLLFIVGQLMQLSIIMSDVLVKCSYYYLVS